MMRSPMRAVMSLAVRNVMGNVRMEGYTPPLPMSMHITHISEEGTPLHASVLAADIQNAAPCFIPGQDFTLYNEVSAVSVIFTYDVGTNSYLVPADGDTPYTGASYNLLVLFIEVIEGGTTPCPVLLSQDGGCTSIPVILSQSPFVCYLGALGVWTPFCIPVEYYDDLEYADFTATGSDGSVVFTHIGEGAFMPAGPIPTGPYIMSQGAISFPTELLYTT